MNALSLGIEEELFWTLNPRKMMLYIKAYDEDFKRRITFSNAMAHLQGRYYLEALLATVGNMFSDKKSKPYEYPKEPYDIVGNQQKDANGQSLELTEEEKQRQRDLFVAQFMTMQANFNLAKGNKGQEQE